MDVQWRTENLTENMLGKHHHSDDGPPKNQETVLPLFDKFYEIAVHKMIDAAYEQNPWIHLTTTPPGISRV